MLFRIPLLRTAVLQRLYLNILYVILLFQGKNALYFLRKRAVSMNRSYRLSTALDVDDLLMECVPYAVRLANEKYKFDPPLTVYEVDHWGKLGTRSSSAPSLLFRAHGNLCRSSPR